MAVTAKIGLLFFCSFLLSCYLHCRDLEFPDPAASPYILPFPVDTSCELFQGYCNQNGHLGRVAYDFLIPMGEPICCSRSGVVIEVINDFADTDYHTGHNNRVVIRHADSTVAWYGHFQYHSISVRHSLVYFNAYKII